MNFVAASSAKKVFMRMLFQVCRGAKGYYPAGWKRADWMKYLETINSTDKRIAKRNAEYVARAAQGRQEIAELYEYVR